MGFQTIVNQKLALGIAGEYADDSPHREQTYALLAKVTEGAQASGSLAFTANPSDGDTVTIANVTYTFKSDLAAVNDVKIGANLAAALGSLVNAINGTGTAGTNYYTGTKSLADILSASVSSSTVTLTANEAGIEGNYTALASSSTNAAVTAFAGGVNAESVLPQIACAFTLTGTDGQAQIGGTGVFAGIMTAPKQYVNQQDLTASLTVPDGTQGGLCTFGHLFIKPASSFEPGYIAAYNTENGAVNAYSAAENIPAGFVQIQNAQFIKVSGNGGDIAVLQLGD